MAKVKQADKVNTAIKKKANSRPNSIKKKGTLKNNLKDSRRKRSRAKALIKKRSDRGVVYLSHIPHGFYDEQIEGFFGQFGKVTQVSVPKGKSGRYKGYAFIEFQHPEVAKIAAETMNNYLMFNRLLKAKYIPPQDQKPRLFKKAQLAKEYNRTEPEQAVLNIKINREKKNCMLKTSQEARCINKLQKKTAEMYEMMAESGVTYEVQVDQGNSESVFKRLKNLEEKRKLIREERELKRKQAEPEKEKNKDNEGSATSSADENLSSSASSDENLSFSDDESSLSENINETKNHKSKALHGVLSKPVTSVCKPLVVNPSKRKHKIKSAKITTNKPMNSNKLITNKPQKESKSYEVPSLKLKQQKQHNLKTIKSKQTFISKTVQKDFQKKIAPTKLHDSIKGKLKQRKSPAQQPQLLSEQKSPADKALKATKRDLLKTVNEDSLKHTPSKKLKPSKQLNESIPSPGIKGTPKSRQTPLKKIPKPAVTPMATVGTPKRFDSLKKSEYVGKSPKKRKSQQF